MAHENVVKREKSRKRKVSMIAWKMYRVTKDRKYIQSKNNNFTV